MDQVLNIFLEMYYEQLGLNILNILRNYVCHHSINLGVQNVFKIWSIYQMFVIFIILVFSNVYIFFDTKKNNPELWGNVQTNQNIIQNRNGLGIEMQIPRKPIFYIHGMEMENVECDLSIHEI